MATGFQTTVNMQQASAVEGDFASANPRNSFVSGEGNLVAGATGVTVGRFAWVVAPGTVSNDGITRPAGFCARSGQQGAALITDYLGETSMKIQKGYEVTLHTSGDFWAKNTGTVAALASKVFASTTTGEIQTGAAGATIAGFIETDFSCVGFPAGGNGAVGELIIISTRM